MLRIGRSDQEGVVMFALCGRIEESDLPELQNVLNGESAAADLTIDLQEVRLMCRDALKFFASCESKGIKLKNCPPYLNEWLRRGQ
jgi:hypothetical protein